MITLNLDWVPFSTTDSQLQNSTAYSYKLKKEINGSGWPVMEVQFLNTADCFQFLNSFYGINTLEEMEDLIG